MMYTRYLTELDELRRQGMERHLRSSHIDGAHIIIEGKRMLNLSSNDYLGIASRGDFVQEIHTDLERWGAAGSTSSRLMTGSYALYEELEQTMAQLWGRESALVFGSGYHMNLGILPALSGSDTVILADRLVHASIIDGIRLSGAAFERFRHNDLNHLERLIQKYHSTHSRIIIVVESIYSMDGDLADLPALVSLKQRYGRIMLYVDEAHAVGVRGTRGLGLAEETGTIEDIDLLLGTFGKAVASMGGYLLCDEVIRRYLVNRCRSLIFSTALPPISLAFTHRVLQALPHYGQQRQQLEAHSTKLRSALSSLGISSPSCSHIIPLITGQAEPTLRLAEELQTLGFFTLAVRPPTVPAGACRLRLSLSSETPTEGLLAALSHLLPQHSIQP